jgi:hypothetical protein
MAIQYSKIPSHWSYFLALEDDLLRMSRWIEFSQENEKTYSIELARLLMTAAAEVDILAKAICSIICPKDKASSINEYQAILCEAAPIIVQTAVAMPRFGMSFMPWLNWREPKSPPDWWTGNNKVKHHRADHAGLLVILTIYYGFDQEYLFPAPSLYVPNTFGIFENSAIRLLRPDGAQFPD